MGVIDSKGFMIGRAGSMVFKTMGGKQYFQQKPYVIKQSDRTKQSSKLFGTASREAAYIRGKLKPWLADKVDTKMNARLAGACFKSLKEVVNTANGLEDLITADMRGLAPFEFNTHSLFTDYFKETITVEGTTDTGLKIQIPSVLPHIAILYPELCQYVDLHVVVLHTSWSTLGSDILIENQIEFEKSTPFLIPRTIDIPPISMPGITLILVQLQFFKKKSKFGKEYINSSQLNPSCLVYTK